MSWINCLHRLPPNRLKVETKIEDDKGCRNEQILKRNNSLWFIQDDSMYVYYSPTHWRYVL